MTGATKPWDTTTIVGTPVPRIDAHERVAGTAVFTLDVTLPGMLHAAILRCPHPHARVRTVDVSDAQAMPGVRAVITGRDADCRLPWWTDMVTQGKQSWLFDEHCRYAGEEVCALVADAPHQAFDALEKIRVEYEPLPFVVDLEAALAAGAPAVHEGGNLAVPARVVNIGDVDKGFAEADVQVEHTFRTSPQIHVPMEAHGSVAAWEGARLTVWDSTQSVYDVQRALAEVLRLPLSSVRVISKYMGGGFGSKLSLGKYTVIAALLARRTGCPVRLVLPKEDTFLAVGNRPEHLITVKAGAKRDGTLTALEVVNRGNVGAYWGSASILYPFVDLYTCPNIRGEQFSTYTNAGPSCAFRAPGFPPAAWALEQTMDALASRLSMDPVALRLRNIPTRSVLNDAAYTSTGLARCLQDGAAAFKWSERRAASRQEGDLVRGVGVAACVWGYPGEPVSTVIARLASDGSLTLTFGAADLGTGTKTVMAMVASEELGVPLDQIFIEHADSGTCPYAVASGGSQTVLVNAPAVREAAMTIKAQLLQMAAAQLKVPGETLTLTGGAIVSKDSPTVRVKVTDLERLRQQQGVVAVGTRTPHPAGKIALPFAAHFAEVEVNRRTGEVRVTRVLGVHDSGRVMNPLTYANQVFGGITMGIGYGMTERRVIDRQTGRVLTTSLTDYRPPSALDVPQDLGCLPVDLHDTECNTVGAKGLGEPATIPTAAAVANAVFDATGIRVTHMPINATTLVQMLADRRRSQ